MTASKADVLDEIATGWGDDIEERMQGAVEEFMKGYGQGQG